MRQFSIADNTIFMQFHYAENAVTASTRTFVKPPKPDYGCEVIFVDTDTKAYNVQIIFYCIFVRFYKNLFLLVQSIGTGTTASWSVLAFTRITGRGEKVCIRICSCLQSISRNARDPKEWNDYATVDFQYIRSVAKRCTTKATYG